MEPPSLAGRIGSLQETLPPLLQSALGALTESLFKSKSVIVTKATPGHRSRH